MASTKTPALFRVLRLHGALLVGLAAAAVVVAATPGDWRWTMRLAAGWDAGVILFLVLTGVKIICTRSIDAIRARAAELDEAGAAVLPLSLLAAAASLAVVVSEIASPQAAKGIEALTPVGTVAASWLFVHVIFGLHYAHRFYAPDGKKDRGGLLFPGEDEPDYWDFLHFSLIIGVACQTADVQIADRPLRRLSSVHSLTAFVFNTVLVALAVNLAVNLV